MIATKPYFPDSRDEKRFKRLSKNTRWKVLDLARQRANEKQSLLDIQPNLYAVFSCDIRIAIEICRHTRKRKD